MKFIISIFQEISQYLGFKKNSLRKQDCFLLFVHIKRFATKIDFLISIKITITATSEIQRACFYIYNKQKQTAKRFIYKKYDTLKKARQFPLRFYIQKARHFTLRDFHEIFEVGVYIQEA